MEDCRENLPPDCCDMRGLLSFTILWLLTKRRMYGQELAGELEKRRGTKPTPGTLYPALKGLEETGLVRSEKDGKKRVYQLTDEGREGAIRACEYFCRAYGEIFKEFI